MLNDKTSPTTLSPRETALAALGAALASNCVPCVEYHVPHARKVGLDDAEIREAIAVADKVRRVPANKVLQTVFALLRDQEIEVPASTPCGCSAAPTPPSSDTDRRDPQVRLDPDDAGEDSQGGCC